jgi:CDP-paratose 2-epimerase
MKKLLVTGSSGLIGSEVVRHFDGLGYKIFGIDNNMRADFMEPKEIHAGTKAN